MNQRQAKMCDWEQWLLKKNPVKKQRIWDISYKKYILKKYMKNAQ